MGDGAFWALLSRLGGKHVPSAPWEPRMVTCKQLIEDFLADYLDAALPADVATEVERHLAVCAPCVAYLRTYRQTRMLIGHAADLVMPQEMKQILSTSWARRNA
jgi:predicted anti-sigma-YlaC factor YlaD